MWCDIDSNVPTLSPNYTDFNSPDSKLSNGKYYEIRWFAWFEIDWIRVFSWVLLALWGQRYYKSQVEYLSGIVGLLKGPWKISPSIFCGNPTILSKLLPRPTLIRQIKPARVSPRFVQTWHLDPLDLKMSQVSKQYFVKSTSL